MKILRLTLLISALFFVTTTYASSGDTSENAILNSPEKIDISSVEENIKIEEETIVDEIFGKRKKELEKLVDDTKEVKDINAIKDLSEETTITKELNEEMLIKVQSEIDELKSTINSNDSFMESIKLGANENAQNAVKVLNLAKENTSLKRLIATKEVLILDLKKTISDYSILQAKYEALLSKYVEIKRTKDKEESNLIKQKLKILYYVAIFTILLIILRKIVKKHTGIKYERTILYLELFYGVAIVIFLIGFFFYIFPQLYILLLFISGYLIFINAPIVGSFMSSFIVFRKYKIGDVIKEGEKAGKIVKITPLHTVIKIINKHGVITNIVVNIPNNILTREKVDVIKHFGVQDHDFTIILSTEKIDNIFKVIDEIKENILLKTLTERPKHIDSTDTEIFKINYEQDDINEIKVNFYWRASNSTNRKIERKILGYVKNYYDNYEKTLINIEKEEDKKIN